MSYHTDAQKYIKSAKSKGMTVKAEGSELIAYPKDKALSAISRLKNKVVDVASDVLSAPKRLSEERKASIDNAQADNHQFVRENKGKPDAGDASDPLFRARVAAIHDTFDREEAKRKQEGALQRQIGGGAVARAAIKESPVVKKALPKLKRPLEFKN